MYLVQGRAEQVLRGLNNTESNPDPSWRNRIQGWMTVRESYSRAEEHGPLSPPFLSNPKNNTMQVQTKWPSETLWPHRRRDEAFVIYMLAAAILLQGVPSACGPGMG